MYERKSYTWFLLIEKAAAVRAANFTRRETQAVKKHSPH
jgi:hypothetical protein